MNLQVIPEAGRPPKYLLNGLRIGQACQLVTDDGQAVWASVIRIDRETKRIHGRVELPVGELQIGDIISFEKRNVEVVA